MVSPLTRESDRTAKRKSVITLIELSLVDQKQTRNRVCWFYYANLTGFSTASAGATRCPLSVLLYT